MICFNQASFRSFFLFGLGFSPSSHINRDSLKSGSGFARQSKPSQETIFDDSTYASRPCPFCSIQYILHRVMRSSGATGIVPPIYKRREPRAERSHIWLCFDEEDCSPSESTQVRSRDCLVHKTDTVSASTIGACLLVFSRGVFTRVGTAVRWQ